MPDVSEEQVAALREEIRNQLNAVVINIAAEHGVEPAEVLRVAKGALQDAVSQAVHPSPDK